MIAMYVALGIWWGVHLGGRIGIAIFYFGIAVIWAVVGSHRYRRTSARLHDQRRDEALRLKS